MAHAFIALCFWLGAGSLGHAAEATLSLRAQTLFNLLLFIQWPEQSISDEYLTLCSLSGSAMNEMQTFTRQSVHGRPLKLIQLRPELDELDHCDVFYEAQPPVEQLRRIVAFTRKKPLLTVLEGPRSIDNGAMVGLDFSGKRPAIDINLRMLQQSHLNAQAQLLAIARRVIR